MENRKIREAPSKNLAAIFLGSMMILSSILMIISRFASIEMMGVELSVKDGTLGIISRFVLLAGGLFILYKREKGNYFAIGVYAMTLGASRLMRAVPNLVTESDVAFVIAIAITVLSVNLIATGYNHITVRMKNPLNMRYTTLSIVAVYIITLLYFAYIRESPTILFQYFPDTIWYLPLYISLLLILYSKDVIETAPIGRIRQFTRQTACKVNLGRTIIISEEDSMKIKDGLRSPEGWRSRKVGRNTILEEKVTFGTTSGDRDVILERNGRDDYLRITVIDDGTDSFIDGYRMKVSSYRESDRTLELLDDKGTCAILHIRGCE